MNTEAKAIAPSQSRPSILVNITESIQDLNRRLSELNNQTENMAVFLLGKDPHANDVSETSTKETLPDGHLEAIFIELVTCHARLSFAFDQLNRIESDLH